MDEDDTLDAYGEQPLQSGDTLTWDEFARRQAKRFPSQDWSEHIVKSDEEKERATWLKQMSQEGW